ncbi:MAG: SGNH/GDSL hydrolase family protein [Burkholderiaceae bacterium]
MRTTIYKIALAPALLLQGARLRKTALRLPEARGPRSGRVGAGDAPVLRVLFLGDSSAAGVGVESQQEAMPLQAAQRIAARLGRPVHWRLVARSGVNTREAQALLEAHPPEPADIVVCALGVNDVTSQRGARDFVADYDALLRCVETRTGAQHAVISGLPPLHRLPAAPQPLRWYLGQCAARLDAALRRHCDGRANLRFIDLNDASPLEAARDGFHPGKSQYLRWALTVADEVVMLAGGSAA